MDDTAPALTRRTNRLVKLLRALLVLFILLWVVSVTMRVAIVLPGATKMVCIGYHGICYSDGWGWIRRGAFPAFGHVGIPRPGIYVLGRDTPFINVYVSTYVPLWRLVLLLMIAYAGVTRLRRTDPGTRIVERTVELAVATVFILLLGIAGEIADWWATAHVYLLILIWAMIIYAPIMLLEMAKDKRLRREANGLCGRSSYDLRGNVSGICPECGTPVTAKPDSRASG